MLATFAARVDRELREWTGEDSFNLLPAILGEGDKPARDSLITQSYIGVLSVRDSQWKLILDTKDLYETHPEIVSRLISVLTTAMDALVHDPSPMVHFRCPMRAMSGARLRCISDGNLDDFGEGVILKNMPQPIRPWYWPAKGQPERTEPFTWIVEGVIAASWWPDPYVFDIYEENDVRAVVNCCEFDNRQDVPSQFSYYHINVPDYGVPTDKQIQRFLDIMDQHHAAREAVVVHCVAGCGRTGQFIVAWCAKAGFIPSDKDPVQWIRARRKCCLETSEQTHCAKRLMDKYR